MPMVNPDDIAREMGQYDRLLAKAGRQALGDRDRLLNGGQSFGIETTLSGAGALRFMARGAAAGFRLMFIFIGLESATLSLMRVVGRVQEGGHDVPPTDIARRYPASLANLAPALRLAERAWVVDNSGRRRRLLISRNQGQVRYITPNLPAWAADAVPQELRTLH